MAKPKETGKAKRGDLVLVHLIVLEPSERTANLPDATRAVPYEGWIKGFLLEDQAEIGEIVRIKTLIGREISGLLTQINPVYDHNFGEPQPELNSIGLEAWKKLQSKG